MAGLRVVPQEEVPGVRRQAGGKEMKSDYVYHPWPKDKLYYEAMKKKEKEKKK